MTAREIAEQIARDTSCAQGEFHQRVNAILPYLNDFEAAIVKVKTVSLQEFGSYVRGELLG